MSLRWYSCGTVLAEDSSYLESATISLPNLR